VKVSDVTILPDARKIKLTVEMPDPDRFLTSQVPHLPRYLFRLLPRLARHTCHNDDGKSFRQECRETEIPHLFEHLIIELQLQAESTENDILRGETEWDWCVDPRGRFHVTVEYTNELLAIGAIRLAENIIAALDRRDLEAINIEAETARLRELARLGRELMALEHRPAAPARSWSSVTPAPTSLVVSS